MAQAIEKPVFEFPALETKSIKEFVSDKTYGNRASHPLSGFETLVYAVADRMIPSYCGGCWEAVRAEREPGVMSPWYWMLEGEPCELTSIVNVFGGRDVQLPRFLAFGAVTVIAISQFFCMNGENLSDEDFELLSEIHHGLIGSLYDFAELCPKVDGHSWSDALFELLD